MSTFSISGNTFTAQEAETMDSHIKYMNLNFVGNSESSQDQEMLEDCTKLPTWTPLKNLPSYVQLIGSAQESEHKAESAPKIVTIAEMRVDGKGIEHFKRIEQPDKPDLYELIRDMIGTHINPDVQIHIGNMAFNCHLMVLQCYSQFFRGFTTEMIIKLPENKVKPSAFIMSYEWMLSDRPRIKRMGLFELFTAAKFLRIDELINQCWLYLDDDQRFREETAFLFYWEARNKGHEDLEQLMLSRVSMFFLTLVASKEFLELNLKEICMLLSSNSIGVNSEIEVFMSAVRWLNYNWKDRECEMLKVIKCVRFMLMPAWYLVTLDKTSHCLNVDRITSHPEVKNMISDGLSYTTTAKYYGEDPQEFQRRLQRLGLESPLQRQWIYDKECPYHRPFDCDSMQTVTYDEFRYYIQVLQNIGKDHWSTLEVAKGDVVRSHKNCL